MDRRKEEEWMSRWAVERTDLLLEKKRRQGGETGRLNLEKRYSCSAGERQRHGEWQHSHGNSVLCPSNMQEGQALRKGRAGKVVSEL